MTDELKPVRCGCGGEAKVIGHVSRWDAAYRWYVRCASCDISTAEYPTEAEAIEAWNRAMSGVAKNATTGRTAKVDWINGEPFCPMCGDRLEWE